MSLFSSEDEAINWYDKQERVLTKDFLNTIPWQEVKQHKLEEQFFPVVMYMRDVERFTEIYYNELKLTPTGRDQHIRKFMDKWSQEEILHAELLNRFLEEAGFPTDDKWFEKAKAKIPMKYKVNSKINSLASNLFGKDFSAVHMTWGAINELSTLNGYKRLWELAKHPVLEHILRGIAREEAVHSFFYWSLAKLKLEGSHFAQHITKYIIEHFWTPVGQGTKPAEEANYVIKTLFSGAEGLSIMSNHVNNRVAQLPGLSQLTKVTDRVAAAQP
ncbi:MAG: ferritin-like domain-containing protein [Patescibacteria group bacterium]